MTRAVFTFCCQAALGFSLRVLTVELLVACGPVAGTESGNPINPIKPRDPEEEASSPPPPPPPIVDDERTSPEFDPPSSDNGVPVQDDGAPPPTPQEDGVSDPNSPASSPDSAATGCDPNGCAVIAGEAAARLSLEQPAPIPFVEPQCSELDGHLGCDCDAITRASKNMPCIATDRFGECVYGAERFTACTLTGTECNAICDEIHDALKAASEFTYTVTARASVCVEGVCRYVLAVEDKCYVAEPLMRVDCSVSDETLLNAQRAD
jgi:hypothetical protein